MISPSILLKAVTRQPSRGESISNNVDNQLVDLHSEGFSSGARVCDHILLFPVNPAVDFWRFVEMGTQGLPGRPSKLGSALLTGRVASRHDIGVQAPVTKTLGDILYADKSKIRVSEDEWLKLLRAIAGGDQSALHSLYEQTHRIVFTLIVRILMNQETAEEVTLDVFFGVWRKASTYDPGNGSVVGWIMNQARSRAIDRLRFDQRKKRVNTYPHDLRPTTDIVDPQQACLFEEQSRLLRDALHLLTAEEHEAIETAFFSELTYEQTANKLNQPLGTVKTRIRSGLGKLREALGMRVKGTG